MSHDPKRLQAVLEKAAPPDLELMFRPMFGGIMGYADGKAFASLSDVGLALKLARGDYARLCAVPGARPLRYAPDAPPSGTYAVAPDAWLDDAAALRPWIVRSVEGLKVAGRLKARLPSVRSGRVAIRAAPPQADGFR